MRFLITSLVILSAVGQAQANLITNGNFEAGNVGFYSGYSTYPNAIGITEATYQVMQNPSVGGNGAAKSYGDHTTGSGLMMAVNGAPTPNVVVWGEVVSVNQNTTYDFAAYLSSWYPANPAVLNFYVNDTAIGTLSASATTGQWELFFSTWSSGSSTSAKIEIVNQNTFVSGNDFALDDLYFGNPVFSNPSAVPEPSSFALLCLGGIGAANIAYRRRRAAAV